MIDLNEAGLQDGYGPQERPVPFTPRQESAEPYLDAILQALGGQRTKDNEIMVHCCVHDDPNPSLSVTLKDGKLLVKCFAGCDQTAVIEALKARNLWPASGSDRNGADLPPSYKGKPRTGLWEYRDLNGSLLGYVARFDGGVGNSGKASKDFLPFFQRSGSGWKSKAAPEPRPMYGLHKLRDHAGPVLLCEGEKSTDAAQVLAPEYACMSWSGGSGAVAKTNFRPLSGRDVLIWPDADEPGQKATRALVEACRNIGVASVMILTPPPGVAQGWDAADALSDGWTPEYFQQWVASACQEGGPKQESCLDGIFTAADLLEMDLPEIAWAVPGLLPMGLAILAGPPKMGKSWLIYCLALAIGRGGLVLGYFQAEPAKVLYLALEDSKKRLQDRMRGLIRVEPEFKSGLANVDIQIEWPRVDEGGLEKLEAYIQKGLPKGLKLVVIDTMVKIGPKSKPKGLNAYEADSLIMGKLHSLAKKYCVCILIVTHLNKLRPSKDPFDAITGSMGQLGTADTALLLARTRGQETAKLMTTGRDIDGETYGLRWINQGWTCTGVTDDSEDLTPERQQILDAFRNSNGPMSPAMVGHATGKSPKNISKLIKNLVEEGFLFSVGYGLYDLVDGGSGGSGSSGRSGRSGGSGTSPECVGGGTSTMERTSTSSTGSTKEACRVPEWGRRT